MKPTKRGRASMVPIEAYNRVMYECLKCKGQFFGPEHKCKVLKPKLNKKSKI